MQKLTIILLFFSLVSFSQEAEVKEITSYPNPIITFNWGYNSFIEIPSEMEVSPMSMGVDIYGMYTFLGKNTLVSMAIGGGLSVQNYKSNSYFIHSSDTSYFKPLPEDLRYTKNKITTVFFDVPLEIRFRSRPRPRDRAGIVRKRNFRFAIGAKIGYNFKNYIKYDGDDYRTYNYGNTIKFKEYHLKNILKYRYGVYSSIGIGRISLFAYYALSDLLETNQAKALRPFTLGVSIGI